MAHNTPTSLDQPPQTAPMPEYTAEGLDPADYHAGQGEAPVYDSLSYEAPDPTPAPEYRITVAPEGAESIDETLARWRREGADIQASPAVEVSPPVLEQPQTTQSAPQGEDPDIDATFARWRSGAADLFPAHEKVSPYLQPTGTRSPRPGSAAIVLPPYPVPSAVQQTPSPVATVAAANHTAVSVELPRYPESAPEAHAEPVAEPHVVDWHHDTVEIPVVRDDPSDDPDRYAGMTAKEYDTALEREDRRTESEGLMDEILWMDGENRGEVDPDPLVERAYHRTMEWGRGLREGVRKLGPAISTMMKGIPQLEEVREFRASVRADIDSARVAVRNFIDSDPELAKLARDISGFLDVRAPQIRDRALVAFDRGLAATGRTLTSMREGLRGAMTTESLAAISRYSALTMMGGMAVNADLRIFDQADE